MANRDMLQATINDMVQKGKGILAADESLPTIAKRFKPIGVESDEENRRSYRALLFTTPDLEKYISGVIEFEETLLQKSDEDVVLPKENLHATQQALLKRVRLNGAAQLGQYNASMENSD